MGGEALGERQQSLGELIAALRPGDACPWCGTRLKSGSTLREAGVSSAGAMDKAGPSDPREVIVLCPECGTEVCRADDASCAHAHGPLWAAA
jgi:endogenous inhibitor of DNA gyrase (YacG/DUF329 family)